MCLIFFSYETHPEYWLIIAANRDEFYDRPTLPLSFWNDYPFILAGRDLKENGTWLGITKSCRIAAITNYRNPLLQNPNAKSRGSISGNFLSSEIPAAEYMQQITNTSNQYNGFNLLAGDEKGLFYFSNIENLIRIISPGHYGISNHLLNTPWPKLEKIKEDMISLISFNNKLEIENIFKILENNFIPPDEKLPNTGIGIEWERILSSIFVKTPIYGTRSSSVILMERSGKITFAERTFMPNYSGEFDRNLKIFTFQV